MAEAVPTWKWINTLKRARLGPVVKEIAIMLATYADPDGTRVRPGLVRLAFECERSYNTVKGVMKALRELGLITKVGRYGDADEYILTLPDDLLERCDVPTPSQVDAHLAKVRKLKRGTYKPNPAGHQTGRRKAVAEDLRSTARAAAPTDPGICGPPDGPQTEESAVRPTTPIPESAGHPTSGLRPVPWTATYQDPPPTTFHPDKELRTDLALPGTPATDENLTPPVDLVTRPRCPHGRSSRLRADGQPRCDQCRAAASVPTPPADTSVTTPEPAPAKCEHGLQGGRRPDGKPNCTLCRRLEARSA